MGASDPHEYICWFSCRSGSLSLALLATPKSAGPVDRSPYLRLSSGCSFNPLSPSLTSATDASRRSAGKVFAALARDSAAPWRTEEIGSFRLPTMSGTSLGRVGAHLSGNAARILPEARQAASRTGQESSEKQRRRTDSSSSDLERSRESGPRSSLVASSATQWQAASRTAWLSASAHDE